MAIKMGVNTNKQSKCQECGRLYSNTKEMYNLMLCNQKFILCFDCIDILFHKTLKSSVMYNSKLKSKEDQLRIGRSNSINNPNKEPMVKEVKPSCLGEYKKVKKCKDCKYLSECKQIFEDQQWEEL